MTEPLPAAFPPDPGSGADPVAVAPAGPAVGSAPQDDQFERLDPVVVKAWRAGWVIATLILGGLALFVDLVPLRHSAPGLPVGIVSGGVLALFVLLTIWHPGASYRRWRFAVRPWDLLAHHGVIWQTRVCIPRLRLQHVDIESGPVDRWFGLCQLKVFTAGAPQEVLTISGLSPDRAEQLREQLLEGHVAPPGNGSDDDNGDGSTSDRPVPDDDDGAHDGPGDDVAATHD